jgi:1-acyl-sn-glycerol-3-phosphate acyltransferase
MRIIVGSIFQIAVFLICIVFIKLYGYKRATILFLSSIYLISKTIFGLHLEAEKIKTKDRLLVIANHPTVIDFLYIIHWAKLQDRLEELVFIAKDSVGNLPVIGQHLHNTQCLISRDFDKDKDKIIGFCEKLNRRPKYILVIFPEGTTIDPDTRKKSVNFSAENNFDMFDNVLFPRHRGLDLIINHLNIDQMLDLTIFYPDDPLNTKCNYEKDLLFDSYPRECRIIAKQIQLRQEHIQEDLVNIWKKKERVLEELIRQTSQNQKIMC